MNPPKCYYDKYVGVQRSKVSMETSIIQQVFTATTVTPTGMLHT